MSDPHPQIVISYARFLEWRLRRDEDLLCGRAVPEAQEGELVEAA